MLQSAYTGDYRYKKSIVDRSYKYAQRVLDSVSNGKINSLVNTYLKDKAPDFRADVIEYSSKYVEQGGDPLKGFTELHLAEHLMDSLAPEGLHYSNGEFSGEFTLTTDSSIGI